jgi:hypothetical protein
VVTKSVDRAGRKSSGAKRISFLVGQPDEIQSVAYEISRRAPNRERAGQQSKFDLFASATPDVNFRWDIIAASSFNTEVYFAQCD